MVTPRRIVCAAVRHPNSGRLICGPRHWDAVMRGHLHPADDPATWEQGFADAAGTFLSPADAWTVARDAGQVSGDRAALATQDLY